MIEILIRSLNRNMYKMFDLILIWSMLLSIEKGNAFYTIGGYILYCMFDACVEQRNKLKHRPNGKITISDENRNRIHIEECH